MKKRKRIDFPPREFSSVEIKNLLMLSAEVHENIEHIGTSLVVLSNATHLDNHTKEVIEYMEHEANLARVKIDKIVNIISVEKELINGEN